MARLKIVDIQNGKQFKGSRLIAGVISILSPITSHSLVFNISIFTSLLIWINH